MSTLSHKNTVPHHFFEKLIFQAIYWLFPIEITYISYSTTDSSLKMFPPFNPSNPSTGKTPRKKACLHRTVQLTMFSTANPN